MDTAVVRQFLDFFQDFLNLCQQESWPDNETNEQEIKNAFLIATHIEKCLDRLQKQDLISEFLSTLNSHQDSSKLFLKNCFADPPKYILKKIINSNTKINKMDVGIKVFLQLFSVEKLETCLTDLMLEAASKETLLRNLSTEISRENILKFKSQLLLSQLNSSEDSKDSLLGFLNGSNQDMIELLVVSLLNKDYKYNLAIQNILNILTQSLSSKDCKDKSLWKHIFKVNDDYLRKVCLEHGALFKLLTSGLLDCGKLLREQMSMKYFYIELTYSELVVIVQKICQDENLKYEFFDIIRENLGDVAFWENMIIS
ncbi:uncharacterized protein LOC126375555 isoform X1 [Pectinophora gossypiella]|uniref:Uncharacterized protein n=1 Tax=Pectinophora gossypiella TaxID=13191 RepID=A0A1E1WEA7_PECGO|nr:uncharacterized protein LOC126375555 isoform X1 [Pectinophora gossypiella]